VGATLRILPNGSFNLSSDGLEEFPPEGVVVPEVVSEIASEMQLVALDHTSTALVLTETVAAYPPQERPPSTSAFVSQPTYHLTSGSTARSPIGSSVTRAVRANLLASFLAASFVLLRLSSLAWRATCRVWQGVASSAVFLWHAIIACGTAIARFARAVVRETAYATARTIGFVLAALAATGRGGRVVVVLATTLTVSMMAAVAGAFAAIVWAIVVGLWILVLGTARLPGAGVRAGRRGAPSAISFVRRAIAACGARVFFLVRAAGRDVQASFARTSALIQLGSDATAARGVTGLHAIGRHLSARLGAVAGATSRGVDSVTALTATLEQAAHRATVRGGEAATQASGASLRAGRRLTAWVDAAAARARVTAVSRILHDGAVARLALADMPPWARHGLMAPAMAVALAATLAASSGVLLMSWHPAAPDAPAAPAVSSIPPARPVEPGPAITERSARRAGRNPAPGRVAKAPAASTKSVRAATPAALPASGRTGRSVNATQVQALWGKADTRSLDRALSAVRSATLAFQRCNLQMTSADAAVAHCDEARVSEGPSSSRRRPVAWTIDFRRDDTRWQIERISTSTTASNR